MYIVYDRMQEIKSGANSTTVTDKQSQTEANVSLTMLNETFFFMLPSTSTLISPDTPAESEEKEWGMLALAKDAAMLAISFPEPRPSALKRESIDGAEACKAWEMALLFKLALVVPLAASCMFIW